MPKFTLSVPGQKKRLKIEAANIKEAYKKVDELGKEAQKKVNNKAKDLKKHKGLNNPTDNASTV